jgi:hypothetical protein
VQVLIARLSMEDLLCIPMVGGDSGVVGWVATLLLCQ